MTGKVKEGVIVRVGVCEVSALAPLITLVDCYACYGRHTLSNFS